MLGMAWSETPENVTYLYCETTLNDSLEIMKIIKSRNQIVYFKLVSMKIPRAGALN